MRRVRGFSLIELLVAMTLGLLIVGGVALILISSSGIYRSADGRAQIQESARFSLSMMQEDLRMAGYMGCFNPNLYGSRVKNLADTAGTLEGDYAVRIGGFEAGGANWTPALDSAIGSAGAQPRTPLAGSDVLVVRAPTGKSLPLSEPMDNAAEPITLASVEGLSDGGLAVISDCNYADVFIVTNIPADKRILHSRSRNTSEHLTKAFSSYFNATVTPVATIIYFVAPAASGQSGHNALWRQVGKEAAEEVAAGVERMQLEYGVDTDADLSPNLFVTADQIGERAVGAVKVSVLLKSADNKLLDKATTYVFEGRAPQAATDRHMYTPFTTTISLRNQVN